MPEQATMQNLERAYGLEGKCALVTGGGSGIGLAIAECLQRAGARVVIAGRRADVLDSAVASLGGDAASVLLDVSKPEAMADFEAAFHATHGPIDILVNNAGNTIKKPFEDSNIDEFDQVFDVHVRGALELSRSVIRRNVDQRETSITFISSMVAFIGQPMVMGYTVAKTALSGVVRGLSAEFAGRGIRVNAVAPGWIDTDLYRKATSGDLPRQQKILSRIPMGRLGDTADIGWACAFLASPAAAYVTGQVLVVDGGGATGF